MTRTNGPADVLPPGWRRLPLRELCAFQVGPHLRAEERTEEPDSVPLVMPRDLIHQRIVPAKRIGVVPEKAHVLTRHLLRAQDILMVRTGTVGRCALVTDEQADWLCHANIVRLRLDRPDPALAAYLVGYLSAGFAQDWIHQRSVVAVIPSVSTRELSGLPVLLPPEAEQRAIGETLAALDEKVRVHTEIARATGEYRAVLADLLMTGALGGAE
ncbi:restriction endonuclease subunit S [Streptomyces sp. NPDC093808]|uniref:restriction endonuclease subunit S n=1 Tax=unclassified Streptomyces TaxID=2593676 RepID=UPI00344F35D6